MKIEIAIPCYNEDQTVEKVIQDFRKVLPEADVVVYDNNSSDATAENARRAGARVIRVHPRGKGYVVREIFAISRADIIVMADGDDTYEAADVNKLIEPVANGMADMVIGTRLHTDSSAFRPLHYAGNKFITYMLNILFRKRFGDILSGYRAFSRRFIERVPLIGTGFEIETELMLQGLEHGMAIEEVPIHFRNRRAGSFSKLNSFKDGYKIIVVMISMLRDHRPLFIFTLAGIISSGSGLLIYIFGAGSAAGKSALFLFAFAAGFLMVGLILNTINVRMRELSSLLIRKKNER